MAGDDRRRKSRIGPRAFLKRNGFALDKKPHQIDHMLLRVLDDVRREHLKSIWSRANSGVGSHTEMYQIPETLTEAAIMFSYDWRRNVVSMAWFDGVVANLAPQRVVEMGSGAGFLAKFLGDRFPEVEFTGVEAAANLAKIASGFCGRQHFAANYLELEPDGAYDLILCDFGVDSDNFAASTTPHSEARIGLETFCPGCSDDLRAELDTYMRAWRRWGAEDAVLALSGRIQNFGQLRSFVLAAKGAGWRISLPECTILGANCEKGSEKFPALLFRSATDGIPEGSLEDLAGFYAKS